MELIRETLIRAAVLAGIAATIAGCGNDDAAPVAPGPAAGEESAESRRDELAAETRRDLAERLGREQEAVQVLEVRPVHWRSAALGCPDPERAYAQVITPGYLVRLAAGGVEYRYHAGEAGKPFMCPPNMVEPWLESSVD